VRISWDEDLLDSDKDGTFDGARLRILANPSLAPMVQRRVLLHELLHAAVFLGNDESIKDEETAVSVIDNPLLMVLRDNPKVVAWLMEDE
jgi:hypothetical protein